MKFKYEEDATRIFHLHPVALLILFDMHTYCREKNLPFVITSTVSTIEEDVALGRRSDTHWQGRAFDISIRGWNVDQIDDFFLEFTMKYDWASAVNGKGENVLIPPIWHGTAPHIHVQIARRYATPDMIPDLSSSIISASNSRP